MTYVSHTSSFTPTAKLPFDQLISHLRSAAKYPLRITCFGVATFIDDDPRADAISFDHTLRLAECHSLDRATAEAEHRIAEMDFGTAGNGSWTYPMKPLPDCVANENCLCCRQAPSSPC